jgi:hypothetical protein
VYVIGLLLKNHFHKFGTVDYSLEQAGVDARISPWHIWIKGI